MSETSNPSADGKNGGPSSEVPCGTWEYHLSLLRQDRDYRRRFLAAQAQIHDYLDRGEAEFRLSPAIIPVVVHIVYNTPAQNLPDAIVQSQIAALNRDYSKSNADVSTVPAPYAPLVTDAQLQFQLAVRDASCAPTNGITRTPTSTTAFDIFNSDAVKSSSSGGADPWPADRYLNIWVCPAMPGQGGRSTMPGAPANVDGVIVNTVSFGQQMGSGNPLGRVCNHEVGHYFSLFHLFGPSGCSWDDQVADTPTQAAYNTGCPTFPHVSCSNGPNGDMFMNFMDYTWDSCRVMFTAGQVARIQAALNGPRASLLSSDGLVQPPSPDVANLWSADSPTDTGIEPDPDPVPMWQSEDIWARNQNDGLTVQDHQNPEYRAPGMPTNYVYLRIRNRSCGAAGTGTVKLYWAKASTALSWPAPWDGSVTSPVLMGGVIGSQPAGSVAGRGSTILEFPWSPPDPSAYNMFGGDANHFCLLSRIETSPTAPYGMTSPETSNLEGNVRNNNRIVWKNVEVVSGTGHFGFATIGNPAGEEGQCMLTFTDPAMGHLERDRRWEDLELQLPAAFRDRFVAAITAPPYHADDKDDGVVTLRALPASIGPIELTGDEVITIGVRPNAGKPGLPVGVHLIDVTQIDIANGMERIVGGQRLAFKVSPRRQAKIPVGAFGRWWHSHEEDGDDEQAFRPDGYAFPVSHGRWGFELNEDHSARVFDIAVADGVDEVEAYWWAADDHRVLLAVADPDRSDVWIDLTSVEAIRLMARRL